MKTFSVNLLTNNVNDPATFLKEFNTTVEDTINSLIDTTEDEICWQPRFKTIDTSNIICINLHCDDCPFNNRESAIAWIKLADN